MVSRLFLIADLAQGVGSAVPFTATSPGSQSPSRGPALHCLSDHKLKCLCVSHPQLSSSPPPGLKTKGVEREECRFQSVCLGLVTQEVTERKAWLFRKASRKLSLVKQDGTAWARLERGQCPVNLSRDPVHPGSHLWSFPPVL